MAEHSGKLPEKQIRLSKLVAQNLDKKLTNRKFTKHKT